MPPVKPHTTEWRRHQVTCPHCGYKTRAAHDPKVIPASPFGPRLMAIMAMITGNYHVSRRSAVRPLPDLLGVRLSLGPRNPAEARAGDGRAGAVGRQLLDYAAIVFDYWHDYKAGKLDRATLAAWMAPVKKQVRELLDKAALAGIAQVSGACADILEHEPALWTFVDTDDVEPTNNHAEREIRAFVLWRKRSFGTQSARGNVFAANLMTVGHTARKQKKNVLALLAECCKALREGTRAPSLFDARPAPLTAAV